MKSIGTITLGAGTQQERTIELTEIFRCEFVDHRIATIAKCEEGNYMLAIKNAESTGREPQADMYLTEGSLMSLLDTIHAYMHHKEFDLVATTKKYRLDDENIKFEYKTREDDDKEIDKSSSIE